MKKIIFVGTFPPPYGGVAIFNSYLNKNIKKLNSEMECWKVNEREQDGISLELRSYFSKVRQMQKNLIVLDSANMFLEYPCDRVSIYRGVIWCIFVKIKKNRWIKILHDGSLPYRYEGFSKFQKWFIKKTINVADTIIVVNKELDIWLKKRVGYKRNVEIIGSLIPMIESQRVGLTKEIDKFIKLYEKIILTVGTCDLCYGFQQVVQAFREVTKKNPDKKIGLIAVDGNFATDTEEYRKLQEEILSEKNVFLVREGMPHEQIMELMKRSDVFVRGFQYESYGISRAEAILCGIPVIATNTGKTDGMKLYEFGDVEMLTQHLEDCIINGNNIDEMQRWKKYYENEADCNLKKIWQVIR